MAEYKIFFKAPVEKDLRIIPRKDTLRILQRIKSLTADPRPTGCEKLIGQERYRLRYGNYRIVYSIQDDMLTVWIVKIAHRKDVYR
ncbi:MAG: type II toxin-antitoxin system RelE/ParE family toxin [Dehalococcoidales bacterium]|nr:type II toxin-antitoxin system RelE/ParE family toxin [Dehalococcoidales bacterium]